jgi:hypothetical protein
LSIREQNQIDRPVLLAQRTVKLPFGQMELIVIASILKGARILSRLKPGASAIHILRPIDNGIEGGHCNLAFEPIDR